jgi:elongation factor G
MSKLKRKFGVTAELSKPRIAYRETIKGRRKGRANTKSNPADVGSSAIAGCVLGRSRAARATPSSTRSWAARFRDSSFRRWIAGSRKRRCEASLPVPAGRLPRRDLRRVVPYGGLERNVVQDGGHSGVQSRRGEVQPVLLEPLDELEIFTPDDYMGDVLGDLSSRRGQILGTEPADGATLIRAVVRRPSCTVTRRPIQSMTHGRAFYRGTSRDMMKRRTSGREGDRGAREGEGEELVAH